MIQEIIEICKPNPITVRAFIGKSTSNLAFIIANQCDIFAQAPIYICDGLDKFIRMPDKVANLEISRYSVKETKNGITYLIVNTYEKGESYEIR